VKINDIKSLGKSKVWIFSAISLMAFNGGFINSIGLISFLKNSVGYVTGSLTNVGDSVEKGNYLRFWDLLLLIFCFLLGGVLSGIILRDPHFKNDRPYKINLFLQFGLVLVGMILLVLHHYEASYFLSLAMGLQNAMTTFYSSSVLRTTHMTGTTTDLGILLGRWMRGYSVEFWRLGVYLCLMASFFCGVVLGAFAYVAIGAWVLIISLLIDLFMLF
jgi:uncharacterized membrane protein YoaK (UPF0700 family)